MPHRDPPRGDAAAYDRYLAGMDASMRQKVALTAAHLLGSGELVDMGMGSGAGSFALAALYPDLDVIGVDLDPTMVRLAAERHRLPNLRFIVGDAASPCFPPESVEAILDSSILHHVTTFSGYSAAAATAALAVQAAQLAPGGVLVVRDFHDPGPAPVWLDLPADDALAPDPPPGADPLDADPRTCSTAALFERFAREHRALLPAPERGFPAARLAPGPADPPLPPGWRRYACDRTHATEFILRKDYRQDWALEALEAYLTLTPGAYEATFAALGLRVLASTPILNPWIVAHRFVGRFTLRLAGHPEPLDWPPTNYVIVGQRAAPGAAVRFARAPAPTPPHELECSTWRRLDPAGPGPAFDLVRRPGRTVDVLPFTLSRGALHVLARLAHPRPILTVGADLGPALDGATPVAWVHEALSVVQGDKPLGQTVEERLLAFAGLDADALVRFEPGDTVYPSPGGLQEEVRPVFVELDPGRAGFDPVHPERAAAPPGAPFGGGPLRAIEARQALRAAQVGGLPDARFELALYDLLLRRAMPVGAWIGAEISLPDGEPPAAPATLDALAARPRRRRFRRAERHESSGFLTHARATFVAHAADGAEVARDDLEYVFPARYSAQTLALACLRRSAGAVWLGLDDDDLPAAQAFTGHSELLVTPAWRLPRDATGPRSAEAFVRQRAAAEYGARLGPLVLLGGRYHPSPALTPEVVHPFAAAVLAEAPAARALTWVRLDDAVAGRAQLRDGHLRVAVLRAAHALGLLDR